ncbi:MAG: DPP IV N-terminal domain-containing protein [Pirellulales bacterium]|nr:DPP IV N-terminal domain-containing protein [Pirellulales bacterium]
MNRKFFRCGRVLVAVILASSVCWAGLSPALAQKPAQTADWDQAFKYTSSYLRQFTYSTSVTPKWIGETDEFWYSYETAAGKKWWRVNAAEGSKSPLFDHDIMTAKLSELSRKPLEANDLPLSNESVNKEGLVLTFVTEGYNYEYNLGTTELKQTGKARQNNRGGRGQTQRGRQQRGQTQRGRQQRGQTQRGRQQRGQTQRGRQQRGQQQREGQQRGNQQNRRQNNNRTYSPDRTQFAYVEDGNLYLGEVLNAKEVAEAEGNQKDQKDQEENKDDDGDKDDGETDDGDQAYMDQGFLDQDWFHDDLADRNGDGIPDDRQDKNGNPILLQDRQDRRGDDKKDDDKKDADEQDEDDENQRQSRRRRPREEVKITQLTKDSESDYGFSGGRGGRGGGRGGSGGAVNWSPDSKSFYATRRDSRGIKDLYLVNVLSEPRPTLRTYGYPMPGEDAIRKSELYVFHPERKELLRVIPKWKDESYSQISWRGDSDTLRFMRRDRLLRNAEYIDYDIRTGESKVLFSEGFDAAYLDLKSVRYLRKSEEFIWWSERSGWGHFYLYSNDGELKNAITSGPFRASSIVEIDEDNRLLYFRGNAREADENVYYNHLYCVRFDGTGLKLMDPGNANHSSTLSPSKQFLVDNCSRIDMAPVSVLRDASGNEVMKLEEMDTSRLEEAGWKMPETFTVKAADGVTDLYGNIWKPFDLNPKKKYPVIAHVYPGPQTEGTSHTFSATSGNQQLAQLGFIVIQVGHRGGTPTRGKAYHSHGYFNLRDYGLADKKFAIEQLADMHSYVDATRVGIYGHSGGGFMSAAALMREPYNSFFTVAVASAGNHDNNIYNNSWSERYHGLKQVRAEKKEEEDKDDKEEEDKEGEEKEKDDQEKDDKEKDDGTSEVALKSDSDSENGSESPLSAEEAAAKAAYENKLKEALDDLSRIKFEIDVPSNVDIAENLKGHLLLVHGDMDNNVHPGNTIRLVDALIKANKRFDMLIVPGKAHSFGDAQGYFTQRMWEYFAEHLLEDYQDSADIYSKAGRSYRRR